MMPYSVASNKRPSPSIVKVVFLINSQAFNRFFTVPLFLSKAANIKGTGQNERVCGDSFVLCLGV